MPALLLLQRNGDGLGWRDKTGGVFHSDKGSNIACGNVLFFFFRQMFIFKYIEQVL